MKKQIRSWMLFDWASQPYHTVIVTFVFAPYFSSVLVGDDARGQTLMAVMAAIAAIAVAICAPIATAFSDYAGGRKRWIALLSVFFVIFCVGFLFEASLLWIMICYIMSYFFIEMLLVFTNAYLPEITSKENVGAVSNTAWGLGYIGGLIMLAIYLVFLMPMPESTTTLAGLTPLFGENFGATTGLTSAIWYVIFMIPFFMFMPETKPKGDRANMTKAAMASLKNSFRTAWQDKKLFWFFMTSLLSRDALAGIFVFGSLYAKGVLDWPLFYIALYGIVLNITGILGGVFAARLVRRFDTSFVVMISLWAFTIISFVTLSTNQTHVMFIPVQAGSQLPHITFFICGMFIGAGAGSLQGSLRGLVGPLTEGKIPTGEAFGLYGMLGRATAFITPMLIGIFTAISQNVQFGAWPIIGLFALALVVYYKFESIKG